MNPYYRSLLNDLEHLIQEGKYQEVFNICKEELSLPYVPPEALEALEQAESDSAAHLPLSSVSSNVELSTLIKGNEAQKEKAVTLLKGMNLRQYEKEVQMLLDSNMLDEFKGELIEALMEQKVDTPYHIVKDGLDITFIPSSILPSAQDKTLFKTDQLLADWFENDEPSMYSFCQRLLEQEIYENRPYDFSEIDPLILAKSIVRLVYEAMGQEDALLSFYKQHGLEQVANYKLSIERRGDTYEK